MSDTRFDAEWGCTRLAGMRWVLACVALSIVAAQLLGADVAPAPKRLPVPSSADQDKTIKVVRQLFAADYARHADADHQALAKKLIDSAAGALDDPVGQYVLLSQAREQAVAGGDVRTALAAIDAMAVVFDVDAMQLKVATLTGFGRAAAPPSADVAQACLNLGQTCFAAGDFADALQLSTLAETLGRRLRDNAMTADARDVTISSRRLSVAGAKLAKDPQDRSACTDMGSFLCFIKQDFAKGLPLLAKGSDSALAALASRELKRPVQADELFDLANGWWDAAQTQLSLYQNGAEAHGSSLYRQAIPGLKTLSRAVAEKRSAAHPPIDNLPVAANHSPAPAPASDAAAARPAPPGKFASFKNSLGMQFILIPLDPRGFDMGSPDNEPNRMDSEIIHHVTLTRPYLMAATLTTKAQYAAFVKDTGYLTSIERDGNYGVKVSFSWRNVGFPQGEDHPVVGMTWADAHEFCKWLSAKEGRSYRLPTESEWEYAARGGTKTAYFWGTDPDDAKHYGNCADRSARAAVADQNAVGDYNDGFCYTAPVASFKPNAFGLYDMLGNASEWCNDHYGNYPEEAVVDPQGAAHADNANRRCLRGGSWYEPPLRCRCAARFAEPEHRTSAYMGFRVCLDATADLLKLPGPQAPAPLADPAPVASRAGTFANSIGVRMIPIPLDPRGFDMGSPVTEAGRLKNETQHHVRLTKPFLMAATTVTVGQFKKFVSETGYKTDAEATVERVRDGLLKPGDLDPRIDYIKFVFGKTFVATWRSPTFEQTDAHPVVMVSPHDADIFIQWLNKAEGRRYRLPTEAEWEYAARAGTKTVYYWGDNPDDARQYANCGDLLTRERFPQLESWFNYTDGFAFTAPVGSFKPNAWGLYDMLGNVMQWCQDDYQPYSQDDAVDPLVRLPAGTLEGRTLRGGTWFDGPKAVRCASRGSFPAIDPSNRIGFRLCLDQ